MNQAEREQWILNRMRQRPREHIDVLNAEFIEEYVAATGVKFVPQFFGAAKCPQLGRDLGRLYSLGKLKRSTCGLPAGDSSMGFPKWVWSYRL